MTLYRDLTELGDINHSKNEHQMKKIMEHEMETILYRISRPSLERQFPYIGRPSCRPRRLQSSF